MQFTSITHLEKRKKTDLLILPFWKTQTTPQEAADFSSLSEMLAPLLSTGDFSGNEGEIVYLYVDDCVEKRVALLGLGSKEAMTVERLRRGFGAVTKSCLSKKLTAITVLIPEINEFTNEDLIAGVTEGLLLPNYIFNRLKGTTASDTTESSDGSTLIEKIQLITPYKYAENSAHQVYAVCEGVYYARDLVNGNADEITPQYLASCAQGLAHEYAKIKTTIFDKKRIEKEGLALLLAVNRGSALDPAFIIMEYKGNPKAKDNTVIVGKGITYDTGGLNIKITGMETMKCDMGGAAACFGTLLACALLELKVNVTVVIPTTENCVDAKSFKPGDVYPSYKGKTVEMTNSDAEGRLILADGLAYAIDHCKPTRLIDIATLTGAIEVALGSEATGLMSNNETLANQLKEAGEETFERVWEMPLFDEYKEKLKSDIADIKSWNGRSASSSVAATFLHAFVEDTIPWAHLDIAGTAYLTEAKKYIPKYGTGVGVRLFISLLRHLEK